MNIFIIHSGSDLDLVQQKKDELCSKCSRAKVLLLEYRKPLWKTEAKQLIRQAQMILYMVGEQSAKSRNIDWELKKAIQYSKSIVCCKLAPECTVSPVLLSKDPFTHEQILLAEEVNSIDGVVDIVMNYEQGKYINVFNETGKAEPLTSQELFEQYRLFTETSEALVNRRQNVNSFYITANTALITIAATAFSLSGDLASKLLITLVLSVPGVLLNHSWKKLLESYGIINSSKMKIISLLEKQLAASLYDAEWQVMSNKYNKVPYVSFSDGEKMLPQIFIGVFLCVDIVCAAALVLCLVRPELFTAFQ